MSRFEEIVRLFGIQGKVVSTHNLPNGHINETVVTTIEGDDGILRKFVHQKINQFVFPDPKLLMDNFRLVVNHLESKNREGEKPCLKLILSPGNEPFIKVDGEIWRTINYIDDSCTHYSSAGNPLRAREAGKVCGKFLYDLLDLDPTLLKEPIVGFMNIPSRFTALIEAVRLDPFKRCAVCQSEIDFALQNQAIGTLFSDAEARGLVPTRVIHGDPKLNNVLFKRSEEEGLILIDLDTCMPGNILWDYGDMVRSVAVTSKEDEIDLKRVFLDDALFEAVTEGFMGVLKDVLTEGEQRLLPIAPGVMALTLGVRFLTDYILGDKYFSIEHIGHNLERCHTQFKVFESVKEKESMMRAVLERCQR